MSVELNYLDRADIDFNISFKEGENDNNSLFSNTTSGNMFSHSFIDKNFDGKTVNIKEGETIYTETISNYDKTSSLSKNKEICTIRMRHSNCAEFDLSYKVASIFNILIIYKPYLRLKIHHLCCCKEENVKRIINFIRNYNGQLKIFKKCSRKRFVDLYSNCDCNVSISIKHAWLIKELEDCLKDIGYKIIFNEFDDCINMIAEKIINKTKINIEQNSFENEMQIDEYIDAEELNSYLKKYCNIIKI